jgi:oxygen-independent coproporphyrinogen-3 oxidase
MGFGVNAISSTMGHVMTQTHSKKVYRDAISQGRIPCETSMHERALDYARPLVLRLPYHGRVEKRHVRWDEVHPEVLEKLERVKQEALVVEDETSLSLTKLGWYWYVNLMYFLMPHADQLLMNGMVIDKLKDRGRRFSKRELLFPIVPVAAA